MKKAQKTLTKLTLSHKRTSLYHLAPVKEDSIKKIYIPVFDIEFFFTFLVSSAWLVAWLSG